MWCVTSFLDRVQTTLLSVSALQQQLLADLNDEDGGCRWWGNAHLEPWANILIFDYALSAVAAVEDSLSQAAYHEEQYRQIAFAEEQRVRAAARAAQQAGQPFEFGPELNLAESSVRLAAHLTGFFRALGSALDNLAVATVVVAGADLSLQKVGATRLLDAVSDPRRVTKVLTATGDGGVWQAEHMAAFRGATEEDGPEGWLAWTLDMRNALVHRPHPIGLVTGKQVRRDGIRMSRSLWRRPVASAVESWATGEQREVYLNEDAQTSLTGALDATLALANAAASQAVQLWQRRRDAPETIKQPSGQWPRLLQLTPGFVGFDPQPQVEDVDVLRVHPLLGRRLRAAQVMDSARLKWQRWRALDTNS